MVMLISTRASLAGPSRLTINHLSTSSRRYLSDRARKVLSALDLPGPDTVLPGVYDGSWKGSGAEMLSKCPATGEIIGRVRGVRPAGVSLSWKEVLTERA